MGKHDAGRKADSGYRELAHTADVAIEVWAPDLASLFVQAAHGMNHLAGIGSTSPPRVERNLELQAIDDESLLVAFLTELVYAQEHEKLAFDSFEIQITNGALAGRAHGGEVRALARPIKAVTYHNLEIRRSAEGLRAQITFDV